MSPAPTPKPLPSKIYLAVWRWHFWAGLIVSPVLIVVAVTGALYVFAPEIERALHPEIHYVTPKGEPVGLDAFAAAVEKNYPDHTLHLATIHPNPRRSWEGYLEPKDEAADQPLLHAFFDPYRGKLIAAHSSEEGFFATVLALHRQLLAGIPGRIVVETATCWGIISMLSGLYLWWPRKKEKLWGVWLPRIRGRFRTVLRDWHTVPAMYFSLFVLAIMGSGLLFTLIWGTAWFAGNAFTGGLPDYYLAPPRSDVPEAESPELLSFDAAYARAREHFDFSTITHSVHLPHAGESESFQVLSDITNPWKRMGFVYLDAYTGELLRLGTSDDFPARTWITLFFYPVHVGSIFGLPTKILAVVACLMIVMMSLTGIWMWWCRRPSGKLGAPRRAPPGTVPPWIVWLTLALAVLLPTVGLTLLLTGAIGFLRNRLSRRSRAT